MVKIVVFYVSQISEETCSNANSWRQKGVFAAIVEIIYGVALRKSAYSTGYYEKKRK
jgi:hypothetical protein